MKRLLVLAAALALQPESAAMTRPRVAVRAEIATSRVYDEFESEKERRKFLARLEEKVAKEAGKIRCLAWQAGASPPGSPPQAELWVRLVDGPSKKSPQVVLSYAGNYGEPLPAKPDPAASSGVLEPLPPTFDRVLLEGHAGRLTLLEINFNEEVHKQFEEQSFEEQLNRAFVSKVVIAGQVELNDEHQAVIVPVEAQEMYLESGASVRLLLDRAPIRGDMKDCVIAFKSRGPWYHQKYQGGLRCDFPPTQVDCFPALTWMDLKRAKDGAARRAVYLGEHTHSGARGVRRHWDGQK